MFVKIVNNNGFFPPQAGKAFDHENEIIIK